MHVSLSDSSDLSPPPGGTHPIWSRTVRYALAVHLLDVGGPVTIGGLVAYLETTGLVPGGRPSKVVSDALRWEVARGRVRHPRRGVYAPGRMPRSTEWWLRQRVAQLVREHGAALAGSERARSVETL